jgi:hypothetical protein
VTAQPAQIAQIFSFTGFSTNNPNSQQPGGSLDASFAQQLTQGNEIILWASGVLNADGTMNTTSLQNALALIDASPAGTGANTVSDGPSLLNAELAQAWAEYLPGPLPASTLANYAITGDHYSSRWWAAQCAIQTQTQALALAEFANSVQAAIAQGTVTIVAAAPVIPLSPLAGDGTTVQFALTRTDTTPPASITPDNAQELLVVMDGVPLRPNTDFTVSVGHITFSSAPDANSVIWMDWYASGAQGSTTQPATIIDCGTY